MLKKLLFQTVFTLLITSCFAQYTQIGIGAFNRNNLGPIVSSSDHSGYYSRMAYIWPQATLGELTHGDTISALSFKSFVFDTLRGNCTMRIYLKSTDQADFGAGALNWVAETRNDMVLVYEDNPNQLISNIPSYVPFNFNKVNGYAWDTTGAKVNLQVLVEFIQNTNQEAPISWYCETNATVSGFVSSNEGKFLYDSSSNGIDSMTNRQSIFRPTMRVHYPRFDNDLEIQDIYALGRVPLLMKQPDSIKVAVYNAGGKSVNSAKAYLEVKGANSFIDSVSIPTIAPNERLFVYFTSYEPSDQGVDSLVVTLSTDSVSTNNRIAKAVEVNYNEYSHCAPFSANSGGVGFNGETGDFVGKFYVDGDSYINQIKVDFSSTGQLFQLGIWDDDGAGGNPGTELFMSDTSTSSPGTYILPVLPRVKVSGGYYVGIRQASNTNVGFSFQYERPIRPNAFYFTAPAGDSIWTSFSPGFDFNINIQPRLQVANDVGVLAITSPTDNDTIRYSLTDSIDLAARFINYGYQNQGGFIARYEILNSHNQPVYSIDKIISLKAADTITIHFGKFSLYNLGEFRSRASVILNTDSVTDNNSISNVFHLVKDHDVAVERIFSPSTSDTFALKRTYYHPTLRLVNYGIQRQENFEIVCELVNQDNQVFNRQVVYESMDPLVSKIISLDSMRTDIEGELVLRAYTNLVHDSFPSNDTSFLTINVVKIEDIEIKRIEDPENHGKYAQGAELEPFVHFRNDGRLDYDTVYFYASIQDENKSIIYTDTTHRSSNFFSNAQVGFKPFNTDTLGDFSFQVEAYIPGDQKRENDTMTSNFSIVTANDLQVLGLYNPSAVNRLSSELASVQLIIRNNGLNATTEVPVYVEITDNKNIIILSTSLGVTLPAFTTDTFTVGDVDMTRVGDYYVYAENRWIDEDEPNHLDTLETKYIVRASEDLALLEIVNPIDNALLELNQEVAPTVRMRNMGLDTLKNLAVEIVILDDNDQHVLKDTALFDRLITNRNDLAIADLYHADEPGNFKIKARSLNEDDISENNHVESVFSVVLRRDIAIVTSNDPRDGDNLPRNLVHRPKLLISNRGEQNYEKVRVQCRVEVDENEIYEDTRFVDITAGMLETVLFDSALSYDQLAAARAYFTVSAFEDQIPTNDLLTVSFNFVKGANVKNTERKISKVYPNPSSQNFVIHSSSKIQKVVLKDVLGKVILEEYVNTTSYEFGEELETGTYFLEAIVNDAIEVHQIVKTK